MERALVVGASGLIGGWLVRSLAARGVPYKGTFNQLPVEGFEHLDVRDSAATSQLIRAFKPSVVFVPAALPNADWVEENPEAARKVNVEPLPALSKLCSDVSAKLVYFSSDYVFDGSAGPYTEEDDVCPISEYGRQKVQAEEIISRGDSEHLILRVTVVYGWERRGKNFVQRVVTDMRAGAKTVSVPMDQIGSPSYVPEVANAAVTLCELNASGIYHVVGDDLCDRYTFAIETAKTFGLPVDAIQPVTTRDAARPAQRPLKAGMKTQKLRTLTAVPLHGYKTGLRMMRDSEAQFV